MRRTANRLSFARVLVALVCAFAMTFGLIGYSQARGAKAVTTAKNIAYVLGVNQTGATQPPANAACPYAALFAGAIAQHHALPHPETQMRQVSYRLANDISRSVHTYGTPFRPPRAV
jgi:hypothetical protein